MVRLLFLVLFFVSFNAYSQTSWTTRNQATGCTASEVLNGPMGDSYRSDFPYVRLKSTVYRIRSSSDECGFPSPHELYTNRYTFETAYSSPCTNGTDWDSTIGACSAPPEPSLCDSIGLSCTETQPDNDDCLNTNDYLNNPSCSDEKDDCEAQGGNLGFFNGEKFCAMPDSDGGCSAGDIIITSGNSSTSCKPAPTETANSGDSPLGGSYEPDINGGFSGSGGSGSNSGGNNTTDLDGHYICPDGSRPLSNNRCISSDPPCYGSDCPVPDICSDGYPPQWSDSIKTCDRPTPVEFCPDGTPVWSLSVCPQSVSSNPESVDYDSRADPFSSDYDPNFMPDNQPPPAVVENPNKVDSQGADVQTGVCNPESKGYLQCISQTSATIERVEKGEFDDLTAQVEQAQADFEARYLEIQSEMSAMFDFNLSAGGSIDNNYQEIKGAQVDFSIARFMPDLAIVGNVIFAVCCFTAAFVVLSSRRGS